MNKENRRMVRLLECLGLLLLVFAFTSRLFSFNALAAGLDPAEPGNYLYPGNDLGAVYHPDATTIKVWAPTAGSVSVILFADAHGDAVSTNAMTRSAEGIWSLTLPGDQDGKYYLYEITFQIPGNGIPTVYRVNDPYARGSSANSGRTLIYDPRKTDPPGWAEDRYVTLAQNVDAVLYEAHVRDFTISASAGIVPALRGKYLGLIQTGTRTPEGEASGFDHLLELGVTHVHLLPVYDYAAGDETQPNDQYTWYNWGYDPVLYNNLEGSYASQPDGTARQREFKQLVQAFHQHHLGVICDCVFNHTAATGDGRFSIFDKILPAYYYRRYPNGSYAGATGCGNELASEKPMVRKFILDSIKYWQTEYHVDGFRFDLMGILDRETMLEILQEARKINPGTIIYGEGWSMEQLLPADRMMTQPNVQGTGIAAFNDGIRDRIKGSTFDARATGFVQGNLDSREQFELNLKGQATGGGTPVFSPNESINYDSVHDDNCLWDKLLLSAPDVPEAVRISMDKLAAGILLTAQGVPFIHAGDEFLRSKNLVKNSYDSNDPHVNPIDWSLKARHRDVFDYYRGLITLRKAHPAFRMSARADIDRAVEFLPDMPAEVVACGIRHHANGDSWDNILVIYNGSRQAQAIAVPGAWTIVANDREAGTAVLGRAADTVQVAPVSMIIAHGEGEGGGQAGD